MSDVLELMHGTPVLVCAPDGGVVGGEHDATDLIGDAFGHGATWVAVPVERFGDGFFDLRTRVAGDIVQKFANYRIGLAVLGDVAPRTAASKAFRDFVHEADQGRQLWFVPDLAALRARLAPSAAADGPVTS
ncbi:DUF4180 domain-containing protein [Streptodolium elevatio]|uniref:DUF4180 domain-containing protein n=1 Tax=Streptodolium elevatio TaxID=3157996 RepID=A0ABV3DRL7_9ACTN